MSHDTCHILPFTCHMLYVKCLCWSLGHAEQLLLSCLCYAWDIWQGVKSALHKTANYKQDLLGKTTGDNIGTFVLKKIDGLLSWLRTWITWQIFKTQFQIRPVSDSLEQAEYEFGIPTGF